MLPLAAFLGLMFAYPLVELVRLALSRVSVEGTRIVESFAGLQNLERAVHDAVFGAAVRNNVLFIIGSTTLSTILGTWLALATSRRPRWSSLMQTCLLVPSIIAPVAVSVIWWMLLSPQFGLLNDILGVFRLPPQGWLGSVHAALLALIAVDTWHWTPICFVLAFAGIQAIDADLFEAARVDGASEAAVTRRIVLPLLLPTIGTIVAIRTLMGLKAFDEFYVLTGGGPGYATTVVSLYVKNVFFTEADLGYGAGLATLVAFGLLLCWMVLMVLRWGVTMLGRDGLKSASSAGTVHTPGPRAPGGRPPQEAASRGGGRGR